MKKVWIIQQGSYSDYDVVGIFSTKENAERVCGYINTTESYDEASVDERILDPCMEELREGLIMFNVYMTRDGTVSEEPERSSYLDGRDFALWGPPGKKYLNAYVWARDPVHAVKIVNEHRIQLLANNQWEVM